MALSTRQQKMLDFIRQFTQDHGYPPTIREIREQVKISSTSVVSYHLDALEKKKLIRRNRNVSRGLRLVDTGEGRAGRRGAAEVVSVPLIGQIAAGEPVPIPESSADASLFDETVELASSMLGDTEGIYALRVRGESMIDALVNDGDIVLMRHQQHAENGEMVAARLIDSNETTLKRIYREGRMIRLQPANPSFEARVVPDSNVEIQGKVVMVIRDLHRGAPRAAIP